MYGMSGFYKNTKGAKMARGERPTNFEKIKSLSIEEMAKMIDKFDCRGGLMDKICRTQNPEQNCDAENCNCIDCIKKWLLSEVE